MARRAIHSKFRRLMAAALPVLAGALIAASGASRAAAQAAAASIPIAGRDVFSESVTTTRAGDLIVGSAGNGAIYRVRPGEATATVWIAPETSGIAALLGVYADEGTRTLYACSIPGSAAPDKADALSALRAFDLDTGAAKAAYPLPDGAKSVCNDIAVTADGTAYVSETKGGRVLRLRPGAAALETWVADPRLVGVDGIAIGGDGDLYVNTVSTGRMFRIGRSVDGSAGAVTELTPSAALAGPDGLRSIGGLKFLQTENRAGVVEVVTIDGDQAQIALLRTDLPFVTSAVLARGQVWAVSAKFAYRSNPALKGKDPNPFMIELVGPAPQ
jgi:sugar lactone lactonase YvrE